VVLDVGHNPHAAAHLRASLAQMGYPRYTHCICGMLADKDALGVVQALQGVVDHWHLVPTEGERGRSAEQLLSVLCQAGVQAEPFAWQQLAVAGTAPISSTAIPSTTPVVNGIKAPEHSVQTYPSVAQALSVLTQVVSDNDRIVVFGSFAIVGEAYSVLWCR
jgi:dihydrofolate synthase/folylpolyglutamate synthase